MVQKRPFVLTFCEYYKRFLVGFAWVGCLSIAVMMFSTTIDTIMRYFFNLPIAGVFELNEVILVVCVFLGVAWCQLERGHIRVTILLIRLPPKTTVIVDTIVWSVALAFVMILAIQTWNDAVYAYSIKLFRWGRIQMPIWWARALVPIGLWALCIQLILDIWTNICRLMGQLPLEIKELGLFEEKVNNK